jgi:hypothetical protein
VHRRQLGLRPWNITQPRYPQVGIDKHFPTNLSFHVRWEQKTKGQGPCPGKPGPSVKIARPPALGLHLQLAGQAALLSRRCWLFMNTDSNSL